VQADPLGNVIDGAVTIEANIFHLYGFTIHSWGFMCSGTTTMLSSSGLRNDQRMPIL
jgi:hypothetical protein